MIEVKLRPIAKGDDKALGDLIRTVLTEFKANKPGTAYFDESTSYLSAVFEKPKSAYWVLESNGEIVGGAGIYPTDGLPADTCELVKLYLYPNARGKGYGKLLIDQCINDAENYGYKQVYLESMPELNQAVSLYERMGFQRRCEALGNSGHFGCDIWMVKTL